MLQLAAPAPIRTSRRPLARRESLWKGLCCRRYGVPPEQAEHEDAFWRRLFQSNHRVFMSIVRSGSNGPGGPLGSGPRFGPGAGAALLIRLG